MVYEEMSFEPIVLIAQEVAIAVDLTEEYMIVAEFSNPIFEVQHYYYYG